MCLSLLVHYGHPKHIYHTFSLLFLPLSGFRFKMEVPHSKQRDRHRVLLSQGQVHTPTNTPLHMHADRPPRKRKITTMGNLPRTGRDDGQDTDLCERAHRNTGASTQLCLRAKVLAMHHYPPLEVISYPSMHFSCGEEITPGPC